MPTPNPADCEEGAVVRLPASPQSSVASEVSEDAIASAFTERHRDDLRFDHDVGRWFEWDGYCWRGDRTNKAFDYARQYSRHLGRGQRAICKASVARGVELFAQADRAHAVTQEVWDADPWLLGTPSGTVDLRTGELRIPSHEDYISKTTAISPQPGEPALWLSFLEEALRQDAELIRFMQQCFGYCLTGDTREHALFFLYGPGGNGKSVFLNTMQRILGDYAARSPMETFTAAKHDRHPTELAMLRGARLVAASETEQNRYFAEARIKELTGGDPITARYMRQNHFTFLPIFKLMIAGNHAPKLRHVDEAMQRRMNIVPFTATPRNPDKQLERKLEAEHGRILNWAIQGCLDWQTNGLSRPAVVAAATEEYFREQDFLGSWIASRCEVDAGSARIKESISKLHADFNRFAEERGEIRLSSVAFGKAMKRRGYESKSQRISGTSRKIYEGIRLRGAA